MKSEFTIPVLVAAQIYPHPGKRETVNVKVTLEGSNDAVLTLANEIEKGEKQRQQDILARILEG